MEFGWTTWVTVLVAWPLLGLGVAYLFGSFVRRSEGSEGADDLVFPKLSSVRSARGAKARQAATQIKTRRQAVGGRRY